MRLTRAELALLAALMDNSPRVLSRDQLRHAAFGRGIEPYDRSIDMLIARLRRKIEQDPEQPRLVVTVPGLGYQFAVTAAEWRGRTEHPRKRLLANANPGRPWIGPFYHCRTA